MAKKIYAVLISALAIVSCVGLASCGEDNKKKNFLEQLACEHIWDKGEVTKRSTCQNEGEITYTCEECGKTKTEEIKKDLCEEDDFLIDEALEATCTEIGLTEGSWCARCGVIVKAQEIIPAKGHKDEDEDGICDVCNNVSISPEEYLAKFTAKDAEYDTAEPIGGISGQVYRFTGKASTSNALKIEIDRRVISTDGSEEFYFLLTASEYAATEDGTSLFVPGVYVAKAGEYTYVYIEADSYISYPSSDGKGYKTVSSVYCNINSVIGEGIVRCTLK